MERLIGVVGGFTIKYTTVSIAEPYVPRLASFPERARPPRVSLDPAQNFVLRPEADVESVPHAKSHRRARTVKTMSDNGLVMALPGSLWPSKTLEHAP